MPLFGPPNVKKLQAEGDVKGLIKALDYQRKAEIRRYAASALAGIGDKRAVEPLIAALGDESAVVRSTAAHALSSFDAPKVVEPLVVALSDEAPYVRRSAASSLGKIGDPRAVEPLIAALEDEDQHVRRDVAHALGKLADPRAVEPLIAILGGPRQTDLAAVSLALQQIGTPALEPLFRVMQEDGDVAVRYGAVWSLRRIGDPRAVDPLIAALEDPDDLVVDLVVDVLGEFADPRAAKAIMGATVGFNPDVLFVVFRNFDPSAVIRRRALCRKIAETLFPEYLGEGRVGFHLEEDRNMPPGIESGENPLGYSYGLFRLNLVMEEAGMGRLELEKRHSLSWSGYTDAHGGRGIVYVVRPSTGGREIEAGKAADTSEELDAFVQYSHRKLGFTLEHPNGWELDFSTGQLVICPPDPKIVHVSGEAIRSPSIGLRMWDIAPDSPILTEGTSLFYQGFLDDQHRYFDDYVRVWDQAFELVSGEDAIEWCYQFNKGSHKFKAVAVMAVKGHKIFYLDGSCLSLQYDENEPTFRRVVESLSLYE